MTNRGTGQTATSRRKRRSTSTVVSPCRVCMNTSPLCAGFCPDLGWPKRGLGAEGAPFVESGGLMSYGEDLRGTYRTAAHYFDRIKKGALPAVMPVEQPTRFELVINAKTARALNVTVPAAMLVSADEVLQ
ncbi:MAG: ABC transporter substrate binding protein [Betaproteobacteria bacterium]